jgi:uncharacterized protein YkwD
MIRHAVLAFALLLSLAACEPTAQGGPTMITAAQADGIRLRHTDTVNAFRAESGLGPVALSARLTAAAQTHARDMSVQRRAWHFGSDGSSPQERADRVGYGGRVLGQNISESTDLEIALFQSWLTDPVTRRVMLDGRATDIGFAWYQEPNGKLWWVQVFGQASRPAVAVVPAPGT